jgi:Tfp pilus assembly protein PilE
MTRPLPTSRHHAAGLGLVELLVSLVITALLLTATTVALHASVRAYAESVQRSGAQTATRMVIQRVIQIARTSSAHGPLTAAEAKRTVTVEGDLVTSPYLAMVDPNGDIIEIHFLADEARLELRINPDATPAGPTHTLLTGVEDARFVLRRRRPDSRGQVWVMGDIAEFVLDEVTVDLAVRPDEDNTLAIERITERDADDDGQNDRLIRMVGSTSPRTTGP